MPTTDHAPLDLTPQQVGRLVRAAYGFVPDEVVPVSSELASVSRVRTGDRELALKATPGDDTVGRLVRWQTEAMHRLAAEGLPVAPVLPTTSGDLVHVDEVAGRTTHTVLTAWLTDPPLREARIDDALLHAVGQTAGRVSVALDAAPPPPVPTRHPWELARAGESIAAALPQVHDPRVRHAAERAAAAFDEEVEPRLARLPRSVVHHDLHDDNLLVGRDADGRPRITGILDAGDMVEGPRVAELVVAAAYASRNADDPLAALGQVADGWVEVRPLAPDERAVLLPGAIVRLGLNAAIWAARQGSSRGSYASSRSGGTLRTLEELLDARARGAQPSC